MPTVTALIPAYNEEARISETIAAIRSISEIDDIIVIDDGSTDRTASLADAAGADIVLRQPNRGKGAALNAGAAISGGELLVLVDADLGDSAVEASKLLALVRSGSADMSIATFPVIPGKGGGIGLVVRISRWGIRRLTGREMAAPLSGQRALKRAVFDEVGGFAPGWGVEVALTVKALWSGFSVIEVPTTMTHRVTGRSAGDILHRCAQLVSAVRTLLRLRLSKPASARAARRANP